MRRWRRGFCPGCRPVRTDSSTIWSRGAIAWFSGLSEERVHQVRLITLTYAAVFAVEGTGLWMQRRWAEWLTVIITASLVPLELWELIHRPSLGASRRAAGQLLDRWVSLSGTCRRTISLRRLCLDKAPPEGS